MSGLGSLLAGATSRCGDASAYPTGWGGVGSGVALGSSPRRHAADTPEGGRALLCPLPDKPVPGSATAGFWVDQRLVQGAYRQRKNGGRRQGSRLVGGLRGALGGEGGLLAALALGIGAGAGVGAIGFRYLIHAFTELVQRPHRPQCRSVTSPTLTFRSSAPSSSSSCRSSAASSTGRWSTASRRRPAVTASPR